MQSWSRLHTREISGRSDDTQSKKRWNNRNPRKASNGFNELGFGFNLDCSMSSESLWESASNDTGLDLIGAGNRQIQGFEVLCTLTLTLTQALFVWLPLPAWLERPCFCGLEEVFFSKICMSLRLCCFLGNLWEKALATTLDWNELEMAIVRYEVLNSLVL